MFFASLGILAALAFVLGLGALIVWGLKRFSGMRLDSRSRIPVEVVQRIAMGPKAGIAVVRVGEKVMAVSIGADGVRPLFELDEADRQRVIETSQVPTPFMSSADAAKGIAKFLPGTFGRQKDVANAASVNAPAVVREFTTPVAASPVAARVANDVAPEIPSFLSTRNGQSVTYGRVSPASTMNAAHAMNAAPVMSAGERDFRNMLGAAMTSATRLAVFSGVIVLSATAQNLRAQTPPVAPPTTQAAAPTVVAPQTPTVDPQNSTARQVHTAQPAQTAKPAGQTASTATAAAKQAADKSSIVDMQLPPGSGPRTPNGRITAAQTAPVAGGDDALAKFVPQMDIKLGDDKDGGLRLNGTVGIVVMMGLLTLIPTLLLMMTGFTRILIVLHFLKQAMGTQAAPPAQLLAAMALLLTGFVMAPTFSEVNRTAITPWMDGKLTQVEMLKTGVVPMREFMLRQTREADLKTFIQLSKLPRPNTADDVPLHVLMSAFVASELRTAFQIGFAIYLPFIVIDAVVASVLMSMGMFMLPPAMISLPFKLLLFVLVDGWSLTIQSLVQSFK